MGIINIVTRTIEKYSKPKIKPKEAKPIPPRAVGIKLLYLWRIFW